MTRAELRSLAERVEKATGADRALDLDVWRAVCPDAATAETRGKMPLPWLWCVTSSLDAAVSLAGDAWEIHRQRSPDMGGREWHASVGFTRQTRGKAATPALALTAAALRAMAEEAGDE